MIGKTLAAIALTAVAGLAGAQQTGFYSDGRPERLFYTYSGLNNKDATFLKKAMAANNFEIESSRLALQNGSSSFVKEFAQKMIHDHTGAKEEVGEVAKQKSFSIPGELPPPLLSKMNQLRQLHGAAFDSAYRAAQKKGHADAINLFKSEISHGHDQDVKSVAVKLLPTIEEHYKMLVNGKASM